MLAKGLAFVYFWICSFFTIHILSFSYIFSPNELQNKPMMLDEENINMMRFVVVF